MIHFHPIMMTVVARLLLLLMMIMMMMMMMMMMRVVVTESVKSCIVTWILLMLGLILALTVGCLLDGGRMRMMMVMMMMMMMMMMMVVGMSYLRSVRVRLNCGYCSRLTGVERLPHVALKWLLLVDGDTRGRSPLQLPVQGSGVGLTLVHHHERHSCHVPANCQLAFSSATTTTLPCSSCMGAWPFIVQWGAGLQIMEALLSPSTSRLTCEAHSRDGRAAYSHGNERRLIPLVPTAQRIFRAFRIVSGDQTARRERLVRDRARIWSSYRKFWRPFSIRSSRYRRFFISSA
ncbi:hypothetical protein EYF80_000684 [Liparis tanakae]|uniref:Uncharacterized protein n=1 Tax=Liparis tanakae TaxID=230148 RepID=A0A4Z2JGI9_9TELE|nr:hypothetical protein EYF80_000684 [Liparis tanakae]